MLTFEKLTPEKLDQAVLIVDAAYKISNNLNRLRRNYHVQPDGWFLALYDGIHAGIGGAVNYGPFSSIGMIGVHPDMQRRGIAKALMVHIMAWIEAQGCTYSILDASSSGAPLYRQLGFLDIHQTVRFDAPDKINPGIASRSAAYPGTIRAITLTDIPDLCAFDESIFSVKRERVFRMLINEFPDRGFLVRQASGKLSGYIFGQENVIGPWTANDAQTADQLLSEAETLSYPIPPIVMIPSENQNSIKLVIEHGWKENRRLAHMQYGCARDPRDVARYYGITNYMLG